MSVYLSVDSGEPSFLASNEGWREFSAMAESGEVALLTEYGWSQEPSAIRDELAKMLPTIKVQDVRTIAEELLASIPDGAEVVTVNNGMGI